MSDADVIAVIKVSWVQPAEGKYGSVYREGYVTATVLETLKGRPSSDSISIRTDSHMETGDIAAYCPEHIYLVCLSRKARFYQSTHGRFGVFPIDENCKVAYWASPQVKWRDYQRPKADYRQVRKQVVEFLSQHHQYNRDASKPTYNCIPLISHFVGPSIGSLVKETILIAVVETQWIGPADRPGDKKSKLHSRVDVKIQEVLKGSVRSKSIVIGTTLDAKFGDAGAFRPMRRQLVFLKQDGTLYRTVHGRCGVFDMDGPYVIGWPKSGGACCPRPTSRVGLQNVKKEISALLSFIN